MRLAFVEDRLTIVQAEIQTMRIEKPFGFDDFSIGKIRRAERAGGLLKGFALFFGLCCFAQLHETVGTGDKANELAEATKHEIVRAWRDAEEVRPVC